MSRSVDPQRGQRSASMAKMRWRSTAHRRRRGVVSGGEAPARRSAAPGALGLVRGRGRARAARERRGAAASAPAIAVCSGPRAPRHSRASHRSDATRVPGSRGPTELPRRLSSPRVHQRVRPAVHEMGVDHFSKHCWRNDRICHTRPRSSRSAALPFSVPTRWVWKLSRWSGRSRRPARRLVSRS
jgi:hypothetical protein